VPERDERLESPRETSKERGNYVPDLYDICLLSFYERVRKRESAPWVSLQRGVPGVCTQENADPEGTQCSWVHALSVPWSRYKMKECSSEPCLRKREKKRRYEAEPVPRERGPPPREGAKEVHASLHIIIIIQRMFERKRWKCRERKWEECKRRPEKEAHESMRRYKRVERGVWGVRLVPERQCVCPERQCVEGRGRASEERGLLWEKEKGLERLILYYYYSCLILLKREENEREKWEILLLKEGKTWASHFFFSYCRGLPEEMRAEPAEREVQQT